MLKFILSIAILTASGSELYSQAIIGKNAPAMTVDEWLKGDPVSEFQPGKVYLVEFWGTWCGPCVKNIPHLSEIQKKYSSAGLTVIGVATHELEGRAKLDEFMDKRGNEMEYTVAYDSDLSMEKDWDTGGKGENTFKLPVCFLIDKNSKVVFIGHPGNKNIEEQIEKALQ